MTCIKLTNNMCSLSRIDLMTDSPSVVFLVLTSLLVLRIIFSLIDILTDFSYSVSCTDTLTNSPYIVFLVLTF